MNSVLPRSHLGDARQLVRNHEQTGTAAPSENGRLPPVLAHQLASAHKKPGLNPGLLLDVCFASPPPIPVVAGQGLTTPRAGEGLTKRTSRPRGNGHAVQAHFVPSALT